MMLSRADFLKLTGMDAEALKSRVRRDQLPFADGGPQHRALHRGYSLFEAYLTILSDDLIKEQGLSVGTACAIANGAVHDLWRRWGRIGETSASMFRGHDVAPADEILVGRVQPGSGRFPFAVCGTMAEVAAAAVANAAPVRVVLTNASRAAWLLRVRANREGVELSDDFWLANPEETPEISDFAAEAQAGWDRAVDAVNAEFGVRRRSED